MREAVTAICAAPSEAFFEPTQKERPKRYAKATTLAAEPSSLPETVCLARRLRSGLRPPTEQAATTACPRISPPATTTKAVVKPSAFFSSVAKGRLPHGSSVRPKAHTAGPVCAHAPPDSKRPAGEPVCPKAGMARL